MNNKGLMIAGASIAAGLTIGRLNPLSEIDEISGLSKIPALENPYVKGFTSENGTLVNAEHAVIDPKTRGLCFRFNTSYRGTKPGCLNQRWDTTQLMQMF